MDTRLRLERIVRNAGLNNLEVVPLKDGASDDFEIVGMTPGGDLIVVPVKGDIFGMAGCVRRIYSGFSPDDHAAMIYHVKHFGSADDREKYKSLPDGLEDLLNDAKFIDCTLGKLFDALLEAARSDLEEVKNVRK